MPDPNPDNPIDAINNAQLDGSSLKNLMQLFENVAKASGYSTDEIKRFVSSIEDQRKEALKSSKALKDLETVLSDLKTQTNSNLKVTSDLDFQVRKNLASYKNFSKGIDESIKAIKSYNSTREAGNQITNASAAGLEESLKKLKQSIELTKKQKLEEIQLKAIEDELNKATRTRAESIKALASETKKYASMANSAFKGIGSDFNKLTGFFGGASISLSGAKDAVMDYNKSMFDLSRTYQVFGSNTNDIEKALENVKKNTTFSKQEFADFANTIAGSYPAVNATVSEIADFASVLQSQFGPNVKDATDAMEVMFGTFEKFPPLLNDMKILKDVMVRAEGGDVAAQKQLKAMQERAILEAQYQGQSLRTQQTIAKAYEFVDKKDNDRLKSNRAQAKVQQNTKDLLLEMGTKLEPVFKNIADSTQRMVGMLENAPKHAFLALGAFQAINTLLGSGIANSVKSIGGELAGVGKKWINNSELEKMSGVSGVSGGSGGSTRGSRRKELGLSTSNRGVDDGTLRRENIRNVGVNKRESQRLVGAKRREANRNAESRRRSANIRQAYRKAATTQENASKRAAQHLVTGARKASSINSAPRGGVGGGGIGGAIGKGIGGAKAALPIAIISSAYGGYSEYSESKQKGLSSKESMSRGAIKAIATGVGTVIGGAIGSFIPGGGTMIGAGIGGFGAGYLADLYLGEPQDKKAQDKARKDAAQEAYQKGNSSVEKQSSTVMELATRWDTVSKVHERTLKQLEDQQSVLSAQADVYTKLFIKGADESSKAWGRTFDSIMSKLNESEKFMKEMGQTYQRSLLMEFGIDVDQFDGDLKALGDKIISKIQELESREISLNAEVKGLEKSGESTDKLKKKQNELAEIISNKNALHTLSNRALKAQEETINGVTKAAEVSVKKNFDNLQAQLGINKVIEDRLGAERDLMESANFGMGASVKMMQKQVDLAYRNIQAIQERLKVQDKLVVSTLVENKALDGIDDTSKSILKTHIKDAFNTMKNAKSDQDIAEARNRILEQAKAAGATDSQRNVIAASLVANAKEYQKQQSDSLKQQKKIYDLTKDVREGYLDAIREMASGAGEFEKIIGTQDMGVTQLMDSVKGVTGENRLNTMALGGITDVTTSSGKARMSGPAKYTTSGLDFGQISPGVQQAMNQDIYGFGESMRKVQAEGKGTAKSPTAGTIGSNKEHTDTIAAMRESDATRADDTEKGVYNAIMKAKGSQGTPMLRGVNADVRTGEGGRGAPGQSRRTMQDAQNTINFSGKVASMAKGQSPARTNLDTPARAPGKLPTPPSYLENTTVSSVVKDAGGTTYYGPDLNKAFSRKNAGESNSVSSEIIAKMNQVFSDSPNELKPDGRSKKSMLNTIERDMVKSSQSFDDIKEAFKQGSQKAEEATSLFINQSFEKLAEGTANEEIAKGIRYSIADALTSLGKVDSSKAKSIKQRIVSESIDKFTSLSEKSEELGLNMSEEAARLLRETAQATNKSLSEVSTEYFSQSEGGMKLLESLNKNKEGVFRRVAKKGLARGSGKGKDTTSALQEMVNKINPESEKESSWFKLAKGTASEFLDSPWSSALGVSGPILNSLFGPSLKKKRITSGTSDYMAEEAFKMVSQDKGIRSMAEKGDISGIRKEIGRQMEMAFKGQTGDETRHLKLDTQRKLMQKLKAQIPKIQKEMEAERRTEKVKGIGGMHEYREQKINDLKKEIDSMKKSGNLEGLAQKEIELGRRTKEQSGIESRREEMRGKIEKAQEKIQSLANEMGSIEYSAAQEVMKFYKSGMDSKKVMLAASKKMKVDKKKISKLSPMIQAMIEEQKLQEENQKDTKLEEGKSKKERNLENIKSYGKKQWESLSDSQKKSTMDLYEKYKKYVQKHGKIKLEKAMIGFENEIKKKGGDPSKHKEEMVALAQRVQYDLVEGEPIAGSEKNKAEVSKGAASKLSPQEMARKKRIEEDRSFMQSISADGIRRRKGQTHAQAFREAAVKKAGTEGQKIWEGSSEENIKWRKQVDRAAKMYQEQEKQRASGKNKVIVSGVQAEKTSKEQEKLATASAQQEFTSSSTQRQREMLGMGGETAGGGGGGTATVVIQLSGDLEGTVKNAENLMVALQKS